MNCELTQADPLQSIKDTVELSYRELRDKSEHHWIKLIELEIKIMYYTWECSK